MLQIPLQIFENPEFTSALVLQISLPLVIPYHLSTLQQAALSRA